jgi:hypothetical protein
VVITSRYPDWQELAAPLSVDVFDRSESVGLLRQRLPHLAEGDAGRVADALDNLPLALTQAAAYLQQTGLAAQDYLQLLSRRATSILAQGASATYRVSLTASLQLAFEELAIEDPAALMLLRLAAQLAPEPIPFTLFTAHPDQLPPPLAAVATDPVAFTGIIGLVRRRALARVGPDSFQVHRLVQATLGDHPTSTPDKDNLSTAARRLLRDAVPAELWNNLAGWPAWRQLLPHVLAVTDPVRGAGPDNCDLPWLLDRAATYLLVRGEPGPARPLYERAHQLYRDMLGEDHPNTLASANNLAFVLHELGEQEEARVLAEDTLTRMRQVRGADHRHTLRSASTLALVFHELGEQEEARVLAEDTLTRMRRVRSADHPDILRSASVLALVLHEAGEQEGARVLAEDTLTRMRRVLGADHPHTLRSASNLALVVHELGEQEEARVLAEDTLIRMRRVLGADHPHTLRSANILALVLRELGE